MGSTALLCTDGSDAAIDALRRCLPLLVTPTRTIVMTVTDPIDPSLVTGSGIAAGVMTVDEKDRLVAQQQEAAQRALDDTIAALALTDVEATIVQGVPGEAICDLARDVSADVVVLGTRGRGGIRRAVMGSTSDHVVRHSPCPVLVQGPT